MSQKYRSVCLTFSLTGLLLLFCLNLLSQTSFSQADDLLTRNQKVLGNNFVALVWKDGKFIYQKSVEKETGDFNAKYQVPIGSCSQWMTAALVMTFVDDGKISLDDKVIKFIPIFKTYMKSYITIRHCLTFSTGIQADALGAMKVLQKSKYETLEDEVNAFASKREIAANPGTEFYYSHVGPNIAGRILEIVGKKGFDRLMQERIIRPLKMRSTTFSDQNGGAVNPSGGALSSANDYMNFLIMLLNKGVFEGKRILSEKAVADLESLQFANLPVKYMPKGAEGQQFGLGCFIESGGGQDGDKVVSSLNLSGTWPLLDLCRHYAAIIMVKNPEGEPKRELYKEFKQAIDSQLGGTCP